MSDIRIPRLAPRRPIALADTGSHERDGWDIARSVAGEYRGGTGDLGRISPRTLALGTRLSRSLRYVLW